MNLKEKIEKLSSCFLLMAVFSGQIIPVSQAKPFKTSMIMTGGNLDVYTFLGNYDAAIDAGHKPDLIVGACGGALAAAIIKAIPNRDERNAFVNSKIFQGYLRDVRYTDASLWKVISEYVKAVKGFGEQQDPNLHKKKIPNPFRKFTITRSDNKYDYERLQRGFSKENSDEIEIIIIANQLLYDESDVGKIVSKGTDLYRETLFTSSEVAQFLDSVPSFFGRKVKEGFVADNAKVITNVELGQAARASWSDPLYFPVYSLNGRRYLTGAPNDFSAFKLAELLSDDVIQEYSETWIPTHSFMLANFFAYTPNEATKQRLREYSSYFMDYSSPGYESLALKFGFAPSLKSWSSAFIRLLPNVPKNERKFLRIANQQYEYGYERSREAFDQPKGSRSHIDVRYDNLPEGIYKIKKKKL